MLFDVADHSSTVDPTVLKQSTPGWTVFTGTIPYSIRNKGRSYYSSFENDSAMQLSMKPESHPVGSNVSEWIHQIKCYVYKINMTLAPFTQGNNVDVRLWEFAE